MGKKSKPDSPDYAGAAEATAASNEAALRDQTYANRANQYGPEGSLEWTPYLTTDPSTGESVTAWRQTTSLSPELQALYDQQLGLQGQKYDVAGVAGGRLMDEYGTPIDWSGLSDWGTAPGDPNEYRQRGEDASYDSQMMRIDPQFEEQKRAMELQMRNQGLNPDDRAWQSQMASIGENYNDASMRARLAASAEGRAESQLNYGQQAQNFQLANQGRQQQFVELMQQRGFNLNEINAMISGQQVGMPTFNGYNTAGNAGGTDYSGAAQDQGNFDQAGNQSFWSGIGALAGAGANVYGSWAEFA